MEDKKDETKTLGSAKQQQQRTQARRMGGGGVWVTRGRGRAHSSLVDRLRFDIAVSLDIECVAFSGERRSPFHGPPVHVVFGAEVEVGSCDNGAVDLPRAQIAARNIDSD